MTTVEVVLGAISEQDVDAVVATAQGTQGAAMALPRPQGGYVFHTAGMDWYDVDWSNEATVLSDCYRNCLFLADDLGVRSIAFPPIATETYGFPSAAAAEVVAMAVRSYCPGDLHLIRLLVADEADRALLNDALTRPIVEHCPSCAAPAIPVLFGRPTGSSQVAGEAGLLRLAGCFSEGVGRDPQWQCTADTEHQWTDGEAGVARWQAAIGQAVDGPRT